MILFFSCERNLVFLTKEIEIFLGNLYTFFKIKNLIHLAKKKFLEFHQIFNMKKNEEKNTEVQ